MDNGSYVALSLATAMRREMDVSANNIANTNTAGFKGERVVFDSYLQKGPDGSDESGTNFVLDRGSYLNESQGALSYTGNSLDVALQGEGWFSYQTPQGVTAYGRDGRFQLDPQGNLVTLAGNKVLDNGGQPIALPPEAAGSLSITDSGAITAEGLGQIAQLGVFELRDLQAYERMGGGLFVPPGGQDGGGMPPPDPQTRVVQGAVEDSNVQPVVEMTRMMDIQKAYDRAVKLMNGRDDLRSDMLRRLGRT